MAEGILCRPDDSDKNFILTSGVRVPQYCGEVFYPCDGVWRDVPNYTLGSDIFAIIGAMGAVLPDFSGGPYNDWLIQSIEISGGRIRGTKNASSKASTFGATCFQVLPVGVNNYGIRLSDSTNLTEITNVGTCMRPIWRGSVRINGHWQYPELGGDKSKYIAFAYWNDPSVGLTANMYAINDDYSYDGSMWGIACGQADLTGKYEGLGKAGSVDAQIVIFYPAAPEITSCGINIFNAAGQCTWSSKYTPFLLRGAFQLSKNWGGVNGVNRPMIPVTMPGMYFKANNYQRIYGIKSNGSEFAVTNVTSSYATRGPSYTLDIINPLPLPVISADDYF